MSLGKMHKLDNFFKETILDLARKAIKDFVPSDGRVIPKGTRTHAGLVALHYDDALYGNPYKFDPSRFANMREEDGEDIKPIRSSPLLQNTCRLGMADMHGMPASRWR
ncbi:hypothetical protein JVU11DRAFT_4609 [Chiua virens]|nr:hypothetical protein JVU11DRAFT_4609 [Chiua virens]